MWLIKKKKEKETVEVAYFSYISDYCIKGKIGKCRRLKPR